MANVLTGAQLAAIGNMAIKPLRKALLPLSAFSRDISPAGAYKGGTVTVPLMNSITANAPTTGYKAALTDFNTSGATVTLQHKVAGFSLTEQQLATIPANLETSFIGTAAMEAGKAIASAVVDAAFALVTSGNYSQSYTKAAASADQDDITACMKVLKDAGCMPTAMVANTALAAEVMGMGVVLDKSQVFTTGQVDKVMGLEFHEAPTLITTGNLLGFQCAPDGIAVAIRPTGNTNVSGDLLVDELVSDPETGVTLRHTVWIDRDSRSLCFAWEAVYGAAVGRAGALVRWISA